MTNLCWRLAWLTSILVFAARLSAAAEENTIYSDLLSKGVPLSNGKPAKLPEPVMKNGLGQSDQEAVMKKLVPVGDLDSFLEGKVSSKSTLILEKNDILGSKPTDSIGRRVDLYFVAQGKLSTVEDKNFMAQQVKQNQKAKRGNADFLTDKELKERSLSVIDNPTLRERYAHVEIPLFGRAKVSGIGRGMQSIGNDSTLVAYILDPHFANDPQYPNQWQPGMQNNLGNLVWGDAQPYAGVGGYMKATELQGPVPRIFVEYHLAFDEPHGWFDGKTNLITKLPQEYDADIRAFRRDILSFQ